METANKLLTATLLKSSGITRTFCTYRLSCNRICWQCNLRAPREAPPSDMYPSHTSERGCVTLLRNTSPSDK